MYSSPTSLKSADVGIELVDEQYTIVDVNEAYCELLGFDKEDVIGRPADLLMHDAADRDRARRAHDAVMSGDADVTSEVFALHRSNGSIVHVRASYSVLHDAAGNKYRVTTSTNISDSVQFEIVRTELLGLMDDSLEHGWEDARFFEHVLQCMIFAIPGAEAGSVLVRDENNHDQFRFVAAVGYSMSILADVHFTQSEFADARGITELQKVFHYHNPEPFDEKRRDALYTSGPTRDIQVALVVPLRMDGEARAYVTLDSFSNPDAFDQKSTELARMFSHQISVVLRRLRLERTLEQSKKSQRSLQFVDAHTGLPNQRWLIDRLKIALRIARRRNSQVGVLYVTLNEFQGLNELYGYDVGDAIIETFAQRLKTAVADSGDVGRWSGSRFVVVCDHVQDRASLESIATEIINISDTPLVVKSKRVHLNISTGAAMYPVDDVSARELIHRADMAADHAKDREERAFLFFSDVTDTQRAESLALEMDLRQALASGDIYLHYQPRVDLRTGQVTAVEALARWHHPARGQVSPNVFIPAAENSDLIHELGRQVLDLACAQARAWLIAGTPMRISVNISGKEFERSTIVAKIDRAMAAHQIPGHLLEIEVTEGAAMNDLEDSLTKLAALRDAGMFIALDDFGTGYSSLAYLKRLPFTHLKLDRSFLTQIENSARDKTIDTSIIEAIIGLGKSLNLTVVAEGVETQDQRNFLTDLGCHEAQGFLYSKATSAVVLASRWETWRVANPSLS